MAQPLKRAACCGALMACLLALSSGVVAQTLNDPTRPPQQGAKVERDAVIGDGPVLQSVLIAPGRSEAIISGRTVRVGDRVGEAKVVKIAESEVVLRTGKDLQILKLFPGMEKSAVSQPVLPVLSNAR